MSASSGAAWPRRPTQTTGTPTDRAFSATAVGNLPQPASRPMGWRGDGGTVCIVGSRCARGALSRAFLLPRVRRAELLLDALQVAAHLGQLGQGDEDALLLALG